MSRLCSRGRRGVALAALLTAAAIAEAWPRPFVLTKWPQPMFLSQLAAMSGAWAVLDGTAGSRPLWHQMQHRHPIVGGYVTRLPERLWLFAQGNAALSRLLAPPMGQGSTGAVDSAAVLAELDSLDVRFVVLDESRAGLVEDLGLTERYRGDGLVVWEFAPDKWLAGR